jgi:hypothetical protein
LSPRFCPFCGSESIDEAESKSRCTALRLIKECNDMQPDLEKTFSEYMNLLVKYEYKMLTLRQYKHRKIVSSNEMPKYQKPHLNDELKKYRNSLK